MSFYLIPFNLSNLVLVTIGLSFFLLLLAVDLVAGTCQSLVGLAVLRL